jgi:hypothetical protein
MGVLLASETKDAMFELPPHEVIAQNPLAKMHTMAGWMSRAVSNLWKQPSFRKRNAVLLPSEVHEKI